MFKEFIQYIAKLVNQYDGEITIESFATYGTARFESVLEAKNLIAPISILPDMTYTFSVQEAISKKLLIGHTNNCSNIEDLFDKMKNDLDMFLELSKKNID